jgi:hypothetical protein
VAGLARRAKPALTTNNVARKLQRAASVYVTVSVHNSGGTT